MKSERFGKGRRSILTAICVAAALLMGASAGFGWETSGVANSHNPPGYTFKLNPGEAIFVYIDCTKPVKVEVFNMKFTGAQWVYNRLGETEYSGKHQVRLSAPPKAPGNNMSQWHMQIKIWGEGQFKLRTEPGN